MARLLISLRARRLRLTNAPLLWNASLIAARGIKPVSLWRLMRRRHSLPGPPLPRASKDMTMGKSNVTHLGERQFTGDTTRAVSRSGDGRQFALGRLNA